MEDKFFKKYRLSDTETMEYNGVTLHRILYNNGEKGGWLESYDNLSQDGYCGVYNEAKVFDRASVFDSANVGENANVCDNAMVYGHAYINNSVKISGNAKVFGYACLDDNVELTDYVSVYGYTHLLENVKVCGYTTINVDTAIFGDVTIQSDNDLLIFKNNWSSGRYFCYIKPNKTWCVGCFKGSGEELIKKAYQDGKKTGMMYEMYVQFVKNIETVENLK